MRIVVALLTALAMAGCAADSHPLGSVCNLPEAQELCKQTASLDAPSIKGMYLVGVGRYDDAIAEFDRSIALKPDAARTYYLRGIAWRWKNDLEAAIRDFDRAIELQPDFAEAYFSRGLSYFELGMLDTALDNYDEAIRINPRFVNAYNSRGHTHFTRKEWNLAVPEYKRAIEIDPTYAPGHQNLATTYVALCQFGLAVEEYDRALELAPDNFFIYGQRSIARFRAGDLDGAATDANDFLAHAGALKREPGGLNPVAWTVKVQVINGLVSLVRKDYATAIDSFSELIAIAPNNAVMAPAYYLRARAYRLSGDSSKADEDSRTAIQLDPEIESKMAEWLEPPA